MTKQVSEMQETRQMLIEQMRRLAATDVKDEDAVRNQAVISQTIQNCAKVFNECYVAETRLIHEKTQATKMLMKQGRKPKELVAGDE